MREPFDSSKFDKELAIVYCDQPERRVIDLTEVGLPEIPALGRTIYRRSGPTGTLHRHTDCIEIGLCLRGALTLLNSDVEHCIMPGDLYLNKPQETHCLTNSPYGTIVNWLLLRRPTSGKPYLRLSATEAQDIWQRLNSSPCHVIAKTDTLRQTFTQLFKFYDGPTTPMRTVGLHSNTMSLLLGVIEALQQKSIITHSRLIEQVIESLRQNPTAKVSNDELARQAGMSLSLFIMRFKQLTGLPPQHFQITCRLDKACHYLKTTAKTVTQIADELGFCAPHHFISTFKRAYGVTPLVWRKRHTKTPG